MAMEELSVSVRVVPAGWRQFRGLVCACGVACGVVGANVLAAGALPAGLGETGAEKIFEESPGNLLDGVNKPRGCQSRMMD